MVKQAESPSKAAGRGDPRLSKDGKCIITDDAFYLCGGMTKWLDGSVVNERGRKNYLSKRMNFDTGEEKFRGVIAYIPGTNGLFLNYCPWCGNEILNYAKESRKLERDR